MSKFSTFRFKHTDCRDAPLGRYTAFCCGFVTLCLIVAVTPVVAEGLDCTKAIDAIEKGICDDPSLLSLDHAMAVAYAASTEPRSNSIDTIRADQQQWLAERDDAALRWNFPDGGQDGASILKELYRARVDLLESIATRRQPEGVAQAIQAATRSWRLYPSASFETDAPLQMLVKHKNIVLAMPRHVTGLSKATLGSKPSPELLAALREAPFELNESSTINDVRLFADGGFGGIWNVGGTADCEDVALFERDAGGVAKLVPTPEVLNGNCWKESGYLAEIDGHVTAIRQRLAGVTEADLELQMWVGGHWTATKALRFRFSAKLWPAKAACLRKPCGDVQALADKLIARFQNHPVASELDMALTPSEKLMFEQSGRSAGTFLPMFDRTREESDAPSFGEGAVEFPVKVGGQLLAAKIGHSHVGWRAYDDWIIGFWAIGKDELNPVASATANVTRAQFLFVAPVTPK